MNRLLVLVFLALSAPGLAGAHARTAEATSPAAERDVGQAYNLQFISRQP